MVYDGCANSNASFNWVLTNSLLNTGGGSDKTIEKVDASVLIYSAVVDYNGQAVKITYQYKRK